VSPGDGRERVFPFYVVCDVSESMWKVPGPTGRTPYDVLADAVPELLWELQTDPTVCDAALVGVVAFGSEVVEVLPLSRPDEVQDFAQLPKGRQTDYATLFHWLRQRIDADGRVLAARYRLKQPVVFFLTDGEPYVGEAPQPEAVWRPQRDALVAAGFEYRPQVVAFGFGQARGETLAKVATETTETDASGRGVQRRLAYIAKESMEVTQVLGGIMSALFVSIGASVSGNDLVVRAPDGMIWAERA
jgi:uncharacterized protein YegL